MASWDESPEERAAREKRKLEADAGKKIAADMPPAGRHARPKAEAAKGGRHARPKAGKKKKKGS